MKLHVFNPEHDMALASGMEHMTLPHAIQEFKTNLGFLPALWADNGDFVLVDDVLFALKAVSQLRKPHAEVLFVTPDDLKNLVFTEVSPWGWDKAVRATLAGAGLQADVLPSDGYLSCVKSLSDRRRTSKVLEYLRCGREDVIGCVTARLWSRPRGAAAAAACVMSTASSRLRWPDGLRM